MLPTSFRLRISLPASRGEDQGQRWSDGIMSSSEPVNPFADPPLSTPWQPSSGFAPTVRTLKQKGKHSTHAGQDLSIYAGFNLQG